MNELVFIGVYWYLSSYVHTIRPPMVFIGVDWCSLVFIGVFWCLLVFTGVYWCLLVLVQLRAYHQTTIAIHVQSKGLEVRVEGLAFRH